VVLKTICPYDHSSRYLFLLVMPFPLYFFLISLMESSGQKRGRAHAVVEASSSASAPPNKSNDERKKKVSRQDADGKDGFRSEPSISQTPPNPNEAPSISFLQRKSKNVLRSCQRRNPKEKILKKINEDLHLETASAEKRVFIDQVLDRMAKTRWRYLYSDEKPREIPHIDLLVRVNDWDH
jgi:hypothetical protein